MKKILLIAIAAILLVSCNTKDERYDNYWTSLGVYETTKDNALGFQIALDNGNYVIPKEITDGAHSLEDGTRVVIYYSIINEEAGANENLIISAALHQIDDVLTKNVIEISEEIADSIGNDPIHVHSEDIWISNNYLNIYFSYYGGGRIHYINMIKFPNDSTDAEGNLILEFRHNNNGDYPSHAYDGFVSFDLNNLQSLEVDTLPIVVRVTDYDGYELEWKDTYNFNSPNNASRIMNYENSKEYIE